jgi:hypothetical protein
VHDRRGARAGDHHRHAVGYQYRQRRTGNGAHDRIDVGHVRWSARVDHADVAAVDLVHEHDAFDVQLGGEGATVGGHRRRLVTDVVGQVALGERAGAQPAVPAGERRADRHRSRPGRAT